MKAPREQDLVAVVLRYLRLRGWLCWRNHAGAVPVKGGYMRLSPKGAPDIMFLLPGGRFGCAELKRPGNSPRPAQQAWLDAAGRAGALAITVTDLRQLRDALSAEGYPE